MTVQLTATQQRILDVLRDEMPHPVAQVMECLSDEMADKGVLHVHIHNTRNKLRSQGRDIVYEKGHDCYRLIRLLASPYR